jgi:2-oxoglutarate dehydrogenase E2 component (dihydrolipoamide succinyltransferase)
VSQPSPVDVVMPETGVSVTEGTIVKFHVQVGAWVRADDPVCDIATDKIDTEVPAPVDGTVVEILAAVGETIEVGAPILRLDPAGTPSDAPAAAAAPVAAAAAEPAEADAEAAGPAATPDASATVATSGGGGGEPSYSPVVARMAQAHGIDLAQVRGSGRDGRIRKQDVLDHLERLEAGEPVTKVTTASLSAMRRSIAAHMRRSLDEAAHVTTWIEVDMTAIQEGRKALGLTALPIVGRCAIDTLLHDHPVVNSWLEGERQTLHEDVNLGIAVSLGADGLIVPVIHRAGALSASELGERIKDLAARARSKQLTADDIAEGTFTITNAGRHGTLMQTPIINRPQIAILDVQGITRQPAVVTAADGSETIEPRWMTVIGLSWDHRAIDGDLAAEFLATLKGRLEGWSAP